MGRRVFGAIAAGFVVLVLATVGRLPAVVATHFGASGFPNAWSSRTSYTALLLAIGVLLPLGIVGLVHLLTQRGPHRLNIPARDYWLSPEHADEAVRRVRGSCDPGVDRRMVPAPRAPVAAAG